MLPSDFCFNLIIGKFDCYDFYTYVNLSFRLPLLASSFSLWLLQFTTDKKIKTTIYHIGNITRTSIEAKVPATTSQTHQVL